MGGDVTWVNVDHVAHTVTAGSLTEDPRTVGWDYPNGFDSSIVMAGAEFTHRFEEAGTYPYFCTVHPWMTGIIHVKDQLPPGIPVITFPPDGHVTDDPSVNMNGTYTPGLSIDIFDNESHIGMTDAGV